MLRTRPILECVQQFILQKLSQCFSRSVLLNFLDNSAGISGANLFGGLLDRCIMHAKFHQESKSGLKRAELGLDIFQNSSNIDEHSWILLLLIQFGYAFAEMIDRTAAISQSPSKSIKGRHFLLNLLHLIIIS